MKKLLTLTFTMIFGLIYTLPAQDIRSNTAGFSLNINGSFAYWTSESFFLGTLDDLEPLGVGANARLAYGINQNFELFAGYTVRTFQLKEEWDTYRNRVVDLGARYNFGATLRRFRPFAEAAFTFNGLTIDPITFDNVTLFKLEVDGIGGTVGGGAHFFFTPSLSATLNVKATWGNFNEILLSGDDIGEMDENLDFELYTGQLGLTYFFQ